MQLVRWLEVVLVGHVWVKPHFLNHMVLPRVVKSPFVTLVLLHSSVVYIAAQTFFLIPVIRQRFASSVVFFMNS